MIDKLNAIIERLGLKQKLNERFKDRIEEKLGKAEIHTYILPNGRDFCMTLDVCVKANKEDEKAIPFEGSYVQGLSGSLLIRLDEIGKKDFSDQLTRKFYALLETIKLRALYETDHVQEIA